MLHEFAFLSSFLTLSFHYSLFIRLRAVFPFLFCFFLSYLPFFVLFRFSLLSSSPPWYFSAVPSFLFISSTTNVSLPHIPFCSLFLITIHRSPIIPARVFSLYPHHIQPSFLLIFYARGGKRPRTIKTMKKHYYCQSSERMKCYRKIRDKWNLPLKSSKS